MDHADVDAYLDRIGADRPAAPDLDALRALHVAHQIAVPFENLSLHLGEDVVLDTASLRAKIVGARRGGFCYELNGAFAWLLGALGYRVEMLSARVFTERGPGIPFDHMALRVTTADGSRRLADVGFGQHSHLPLDLAAAGAEQVDPGGVFRIEEAPGGDLDVYRDGAPEYRLEPRARDLADFEGGCWYHRTSPASRFTSSLVCSRMTREGGRITLSGRELVTTGPDGARTRVELARSELVDAYRRHFGIVLDRAPAEPAAGADHR